jgi:hypothetical protein
MKTEVGVGVGQDNHRNVGKINSRAMSNIIVEQSNGVFSDTRIISFKMSPLNIIISNLCPYSKKKTQ